MKKQPGRNRILVITPTYNEALNIRAFIPAVLAVDRRIDILIIDDNSPDKTGDIVARLQKKEPRLHLLRREKKLGLGTAYIAGFRYALEAGYDWVFEMDADFSHRPEYLPEMIAVLTGKKADVVVGSRYSDGISVAHWPLKRLLLSKGANVYAGLITGVRVKDLTAGFVGYRRKVLESIDFDRIRSTGYAFQIEMKYRCRQWGFTFREVPIIFADRHKGASKMSKGIIFEALLRCWTLRLGGKSAKLKAHLQELKRRKKPGTRK